MTVAPTWAEADTLARRYGDAFYLFDPRVLVRRVTRFRAAFRPADLILYPYKANPHPAVLDTVHRQGLGAEVCSAGELADAADRGLTGELLHATGCGRSAEELRRAAQAGATVIIDDPADVPPLAGTGTRVGLRVDFPIGDRPAARFGVPLDEVAAAAALIRATPGLDLAGLHCHFPGADPDLFGIRIDNLVSASRMAFPTSPPSFLGVGGGFHGGIPRPDPEQTAEHYGRVLLPTLDREFGPTGPRLVLEPGTALVAAAVSFVTRIRVVKRQPSRPTAVVGGSLLDISPNTRRTNLPVHLITPIPDASRAEPAAGRFDISGSTPMPDEYLSFEVPGEPRAGDFVCFRNVGAYSWAMAPTWLRDRAPFITLGPDQSSSRAR